MTISPSGLGFSLLFLATATTLPAQTPECPAPDTRLERQSLLFAEVQSRTMNAVIQRDPVEGGNMAAWDYQPSAIRTADATDVWFCGGTELGKGDNIYFQRLDHNGTTSGIRGPLFPIAGDLPDFRSDSRHICAPAVIRHRHHAIEGGALLYYMFYECAPRLWDVSSNRFREGFSQICLASSTDGENWNVWNDSPTRRWSFDSPVIRNPTPVVRASQPVLDNCQYQPPEDELGRHEANFSDTNCGQLNVNYGVGQPSALSIETPVGSRQIWLYYLDSTGGYVDGGEPGQFEGRGMYLRKSWDGFHFQDPIKTNLRKGSVKYFPDLQIGNRRGVFLAVSVFFNDNYYAYSFDGVDWVQPTLEASNYPFPPREDMRLGEVREDLCVAAGEASFVGDRFGQATGVGFELLSGEGFLGPRDHPRSKCAVVENGKVVHPLLDPNPCYHSFEESVRGSTWNIFRMDGLFYNLSYDDVNLSVDGEEIFYIKDGVRYQYDCVDATCRDVESFLLFNNLDPNAYESVTAAEMSKIKGAFPLSDEIRPGRYRLSDQDLRRETGGRYYIDVAGERFWTYDSWQTWRLCHDGDGGVPFFDSLGDDQWRKLAEDFIDEGEMTWPDCKNQ